MMVLQQSEMNSSSSEHLKAGKLYGASNGTSSLGNKKQHLSTMSTNSKQAQQASSHSNIDNNSNNQNTNNNLKLESLSSLLASSSSNMRPSKIPIYNSTSFEKLKTSYNANTALLNAKIKHLKSNSKLQFDQSPLLEQSILNFSSSQNGFASTSNMNLGGGGQRPHKLEIPPVDPAATITIQPAKKQPSIFQKTSKTES
jgi:hypothetical protein